MLTGLNNGTVNAKLSWHNPTVSSNKNPKTTKKRGRYRAREHIAKIQLVKYHAKSWNSLCYFVQQATNAKQLKSKIPKLK
jgi:hypothetical protein